MAAAAAALQGRRWALVGGLAVSARCEPRFTRDIDLAVGVGNDADAESLVHTWLGAGYRVVATVEQETLRRLATVRLAAPMEPAAGVVVDLLFASSGIEQEVAEAAEPLEVFPALAVPVARVGHLIALKLLARADSRPQDAADLHALLAVADSDEVGRARESVRVIEARGFHRGRSLESDLDALLTSR